MTEKHKEPDHPARAARPKDYEVGLDQEYKDLAERLTKLNDFLVVGEFNALSPEEQSLCHWQHDVMSQYQEILQHRIQHHNKAK